MEQRQLLATGGTGTITYAWSTGGGGSAANGVWTHSWHLYCNQQRTASGCTDTEYGNDHSEPASGVCGLNQDLLRTSSCNGGSERNGDRKLAQVERERSPTPGATVVPVLLSRDLTAGTYTVTATDG